MTLVRLRRLAAALLILSGVLLLAGRAAEGSSGAEAAEAAEAADGPVEGGDGEDGETAEAEAEAEGVSGEDEEGRTEADEGSEGDHSEEAEEESLLGVDVESPAAIVGALALSVLLAVGLVWSRARPFALATVGLGVVFAVFDVAELAHQLDESRSGIAMLAGLVALGHLAAAGAAGLSLRSRDPDGARLS